MESDGAARHKERVLKTYLRVICGKESKLRGVWYVSGDGGGCAVVEAGDDDDNIIKSLSGISGPPCFKATQNPQSLSHIPV